MRFHPSHNKAFSVLGYINPNGFLPSAVITVIEYEGETKAIFPDLTMVNLMDFDSNKHSIESFTKAKSNTTISIGEYAYAIDQSTFIIGSPLSITLQLIELLKSHHLFNVGEVVEEYLINDDFKKTIDQSTLDYETCLLLSKYLPLLKIVVNRRIKKNKEEASKILIQYVYEKQVRTIYKKNISYSLEVKSASLKPKTIQALINSISAAISNSSEKVESALFKSLNHNLKIG